MKWNCIDLEGNLLAVVEADDAPLAMQKAPSGTVNVELKNEDFHEHHND